MNRLTTLKTIVVLIGAVTAVVLIALPGVAAARDRNNDRIPDHWERSHNLSLRVNQARRDQDTDALVNRREFQAGMDPRDADSDNDGTDDGDEGAGTVSSFDGSTLTIDLFGGSSISGLVTESTEINCDNGDDQGDEDQDGVGGDDDQGDDDQGDNLAVSAGSEDPGDDEGDDADENDDEVACSTADLVPGAVVQEAELEIDNGQAVFEEIELAV